MRVAHPHTHSCMWATFSSMRVRSGKSDGTSRTLRCEALWLLETWKTALRSCESLWQRRQGTCAHSFVASPPLTDDIITPNVRGFACNTYLKTEHNHCAKFKWRIRGVEGKA